MAFFCAALHHPVTAARPASPAASILPDKTTNASNGPEAPATRDEQFGDLKRKSSLAVGQKWLLLVPLLLIVVGSVLPRINHIDKSIWTAEAWVANSVLTDSYSDMFYYDAWLQTTPPLLLLLMRGVVRLGGLSVFSLRAVPLALGILSVVLMAWISRLVLRVPFAALATTLVALSPPAVVFSKQVKQYTADIAATCMLLLAACYYLNRPDRRRYLALLTAVVIALFLSYPAVCFVPLVAWVLARPGAAVEVGSIMARARISRTATFLLLSGAVCTINEIFFIRPNSTGLLASYWQNGFPRFHDTIDIVRFYVTNFGGMAIYFYLPLAAKDALKSLAVPAVLPLVFLFIAIITVGLASVRHERRYVHGLILCALPIGTLAVLNALHLYPVNSRRLTLFILPCVALGTAILLQSFTDLISHRVRPQLCRIAAAGFTAACVIVVFAAGAHADNWSNYWLEDEDTASALRYLRSEARPDDVVYVHASVRESFILHKRILDWRHDQVSYGNTGSPCCTRFPEPSFVSTAAEHDYVVRDFDDVVGTSLRSGRLWLVFTGRPSHWSGIGRNESAIIRAHLGDAGCRQDLSRQFGYEVVDRFRCGEPNAALELTGAPVNQ